MKKDNYYYEVFSALADYAKSAASLLCATFAEYNPATAAEKRAQMHKIEHDADYKKHEMKKKLLHEFITPIEREDVMLLSEQLDDVVDYIDDALTRIYMYNVTVITPEAAALAANIEIACERMCEMFAEFENFRKSEKIMQDIILINQTEEENDKIYFDAMRKLYTSDMNALAIMTWSRIYDCLEDASDAAEHVSDAVETVIMKNT